VDGNYVEVQSHNRPLRIAKRHNGHLDIYLMEVRSMGGLSGSPVFVRQPVSYGPAEVADHADWIYGVGGRYFLLGMARSRWDKKESEMNSFSPQHDPKRGVNMGIGIITPAYKILEALNHPEFVKGRKAFEAAVRKRFVR